MFKYILQLLDLVDSLGKFTEVQSRKIISGLADAVVHCHKQGVVHRDIKLENLLFTSRDEADRKVKLTDFGISRVLTAGQKVSEVCGTLTYCAPEVL